MKMRMHKNIVILTLRKHPDELKKISPDWAGTVEEFIAALETDPRQWLDEFENSKQEN